MIPAIPSIYSRLIALYLLISPLVWQIFTEHLLYTSHSPCSHYKHKSNRSNSKGTKKHIFSHHGVSSLRMNVGMHVDIAIGSGKSSGEVTSRLTGKELAL